MVPLPGASCFEPLHKALQPTVLDQQSLCEHKQSAPGWRILQACVTIEQDPGARRAVEFIQQSELGKVWNRAIFYPGLASASTFVQRVNLRNPYLMRLAGEAWV